MSSQRRNIDDAGTKSCTYSPITSCQWMRDVKRSRHLLKVLVPKFNLFKIPSSSEIIGHCGFRRIIAARNLECHVQACNNTLRM
jgi:hypothetical protein